MLVVDCIEDVKGWSPIHHLVDLASRLLEARVIRANRYQPLSLATKLAAIVRGRRKRCGVREACLLICASPTDLLKVLNVDDWDWQFGMMAAWIIDSFWLEHIPFFARFSRSFDHFFVTSLEDTLEWQRITGAPSTWLPWGTDALDLGSDAAERPWDILRLGRQPQEWNDDLSNTAAARLLNLSYQGRIPGDTLTGLENQKLVMRAYGSAKYLLAFSNVINPGNQTHPTKQYLTGRWVDALAGGAIVAGIAPRGADADSLLWDGATLELGTMDRSKGLEIIADARKSWTPARAARNHWMALQRLDWRWRLKTLAEILSAETPALRDELARLSARIEALGGAVSGLGPERRDIEFQ
jgi:hypothetical protein